MTKETVGKIATDLAQKQQEKISVMEQQEAMQKDYMKHLCDTIDDGYNKYDGDFFVTVLTKREKLLPNVFRNYFMHRKSCPTPNYDQSLFRYNKELGQVEYIWTIPDRDVCKHLLENESQLPKDEQQLLSFVKMFKAGALGELCKKYNNEKPDSPELIKKGD